MVEDMVVGRHDGFHAYRLTQTGMLVSRVLNLAPGYELVLETLFSVARRQITDRHQTLDECY